MTYSVKTSVTVHETKTRTTDVHIGINQQKAHPSINRNRWEDGGILFRTVNGGPSYKNPEKYTVTILTSPDASHGDRRDAAGYDNNAHAMTFRGKDIPEQSFIEVRPYAGDWFISWSSVSESQRIWLDSQLKSAIIAAIEKNKNKLKLDAYNATVKAVNERIQKAEKELEELKKEALDAIEKMTDNL